MNKIKTFFKQDVSFKHQHILTCGPAHINVWPFSNVVFSKIYIYIFFNINHRL